MKENEEFTWEDAKNVAMSEALGCVWAWADFGYNDTMSIVNDAYVKAIKNWNPEKASLVTYFGVLFKYGVIGEIKKRKKNICFDALELNIEDPNAEPIKSIMRSECIESLKAYLYEYADLGSNNDYQRKIKKAIIDRKFFSDKPVYNKIIADDFNVGVSTVSGHAITLKQEARRWIDWYFNGEKNKFNQTFERVR